MLEEIKQKVQEITHKEIIKRVFNHLVNNFKHPSGCNCQYCLLIKQYTEEKKQLHRVNKKLNNDSYFEYFPDLLEEYNHIYYTILTKLKPEIKDLKKSNYI